MGTTPAPLTRDEALDLLATVVAERPDYVYRKIGNGEGAGFCAYADDAAPSCVVGHVLARRGWPIETLREFDADGWSACQLPETVADEDARSVLNEAQCMQDSGRPWLDALGAALAFSDSDTCQACGDPDCYGDCDGF